MAIRCINFAECRKRRSIHRRAKRIGDLKSPEIAIETRPDFSGYLRTSASEVELGAPLFGWMR